MSRIAPNAAATFPQQENAGPSGVASGGDAHPAHLPRRQDTVVHATCCNHSASGPASQAESGVAKPSLLLRARIFAGSTSARAWRRIYFVQPCLRRMSAGNVASHSTSVIDKRYARFNAKGHGVTILVTEQRGQAEVQQIRLDTPSQPSPSPRVAGRSGSVSAGQSWVNSGAERNR